MRAVPARPKQPDTETPPGRLARGHEALRRYDWAEARDALSGLDSAEAFEGLARAYRWLDDQHGTLDSGERAFAAYQRRGERASAARVAIWLAIDELEFRGQAAVANGWLRRAHRLLEPLDPAPEHALLAGVESYLALMLHNDPPAAIKLANRSISSAAATGATDIEMVSLAMKGLALVALGDIESGMPLLDEASATALSDEIEDPTMRSTTLCTLMDACDRARDYERASQWSVRIREAAERWGLPAVITVCRPHYAVVLTWRGEWERAESELHAAIDELTASRPLLVTEGLVRLAELRLRQGRVDEASDLFTRVEHEDIAQVGRAELALYVGDAATALEIAERHIHHISLDDRLKRAPALDVLARARIAVGNLDGAAEAVDELRSIGGAVGTVALRATASAAAGQLAAARGDLEGARTALEDAIDLYVRAGAPFDAARTRVELGRVHNTRGVAAAEREWRAARAAFETVGASGEAARATALLHATPLLETATDGHDTASGLSAREVETLRLIAHGYSNREIADALVLSIRTVERHISNLYGKLDASGKTARATVTARAFRLGLVSSLD
jgi:ATP/maltotriose-dependent transcriptional regulator MalT